MALNFPSNPTVNDTYNSLGVSWRWDGTTWKVVANPGSTILIGIQDEGTNVGTAGTVNFVGSGVTVSLINDVANCIVTGGGGGNVVGTAGTWGVSDVGIHTNKSVGIGTTNPITPLQVEDLYGVKTGKGEYTAIVGYAQTVDSWSLTDFSTAEYTFFINNTGNVQAQKILVMDDSASGFAYDQEYAVMYHEDRIVSIASTLIGGTTVELWLKTLPNQGGTINYKFTRQTII